MQNKRSPCNAERQEGWRRVLSTWSALQLKWLSALQEEERLTEEVGKERNGPYSSEHSLRYSHDQVSWGWPCVLVRLRTLPQLSLPRGISRSVVASTKSTNSPAQPSGIDTDRLSFSTFGRISHY